MTSFFLFFLTVLGAVYSITTSIIGMPLRVLLAKRILLFRVLLYCPYCMGFWVGLALTPLFPSFHEAWGLRILICSLGGIGASLFSGLFPAFTGAVTYEEESAILEGKNAKETKEHE